MKNSIMPLFFAAIMFFISGCGGLEPVSGSPGLVIISTVFPGYDFARQICGDNARVSVLIPPGTEIHSYEPSARSMQQIQDCDLFIYTGGESDSWVDRILNALDKPVSVLRLIDCVNAVEQDEQDDHQHTDECDHPEQIVYDDHVWTSPANAADITRAILEAVIRADETNRATYEEKAELYINSLNELDRRFADFFAAAGNKTLVFGDRFPFKYFALRYGLEYYSALPGCGAEIEASLKDIQRLKAAIKEKNVTTVFYLESSSGQIAKTIAEDTKIKTAVLHSCHNVSKEQADNGATYISLMEENLDVLMGALK
ncbi:MAG: metal ABC transporter substrate-binding protein [Oscillospiraceae bacterium]|nr:metal ABC transporter substrate-binding protein [Oscillospiraceae bacterium]